MIGMNEHGNKCVKCKEWVNPYEGLNLFVTSNTFHKHCLDECLPKLVNHCNNIMGVLNETH